MFAEEFVQSYERQINEFKRLDPSDTMLPVPALEPISEEDFKAEEMTDTFDVLEDTQDDIENHEQDDEFADESDDDSDDDFDEDTAKA